MVDQVLLDPLLPRQQVVNEPFREYCILFQQFRHGLPCDCEQGARNDCHRGGSVRREAGHARLSDEIAWPEDS